jgi:hypothetical protein
MMRSSRSICQRIQIALVAIINSFQVYASPQMPDYIIFQGDTIATYNLILEQYLQKHENIESEKLFGLSFRGGASFNCWRGYQAIYRIDNDSLFLVEIISCGEMWGGKIDKTASTEKMKALFKERVVNDRVYIDWFSGDFSFPLSNKVVRWDGVFYKIFENETVVKVGSGKVLKVEAVQNYVDDPKAINRRDKAKISSLLFNKLKKIKWKNVDECDCSEEYIITIDEGGKISKVNMAYTPEEIDQFVEQDDFTWCTNRIYNALKQLRFDVIKDKGTPIAEDVYLEIWITEKGKIENWTR